MASVFIDIPGIGNVEAKNAASEATLQAILQAMQAVQKNTAGGSRGGAGGGAGCTGVAVVVASLDPNTLKGGGALGYDDSNGVVIGGGGALGGVFHAS